jgi:hypothetical protein
MNKKLMSLFIFTILTIGGVYAQKSTISGVLLDKDTNVSIPFATIVVLNENASKTITGAISSESGKFNIDNLDLGTYTLQFSFMGYESITKKNIVINKANSKVNVGNVALTPHARN